MRDETHDHMQEVTGDTSRVPEGGKAAVGGVEVGVGIGVWRWWG